MNSKNSTLKTLKPFTAEMPDFTPFEEERKPNTPNELRAQAPLKNNDEYRP